MRSTKLTPGDIDGNDLIDIDADVETNNSQPVTVEEIVN